MENTQNMSEQDKSTATSKDTYQKDADNTKVNSPNETITEPEKSEQTSSPSATGHSPTDNTDKNEKTKEVLVQTSQAQHKRERKWRVMDPYEFKEIPATTYIIDEAKQYEIQKDPEWCRVLTAGGGGVMFREGDVWADDDWNVWRCRHEEGPVLVINTKWIIKQIRKWIDKILKYF